MTIQRVEITHEEGYPHSPMTGHPACIDGKINKDDPHLVFVYDDESNEYEFAQANHGIDPKAHPNDLSKWVDLIIAVDDDTWVGYSYFGYRFKP